MLEVQHPVDYFKKEREVNEPVEREQYTEQISKSHKFERNRRVNTRLPENFEIGKAVGRGDCFFDAVVQGLKQLKPEMDFTVKSLRMVCKEFAQSQLDNGSSWLTKALKSETEPINEYLPRIEFTVSEIDKNLEEVKLLQLKSPIWGRTEIEGRIICKKYSIKLHVIEKYNVEGKEIWAHQIVDESGSKSIGDINYDEANTIHIINNGNSHFEPILNTRNTAQVSSIDEKDENPEPVEIEQPGTSERAGKKRPSIGEEDQSMVKKINLLSQEEDKLAHEYVKYFIIEFQVIIKFYKNYQGKTFSEMVNIGEAKRVVSEIFSGVVSALPGIFTHDTHKHGAIPAMTATSKNIFFPYVNFIIESFLGDKEQKMKIKKKLEAITKDKSDEDLNKEVLEAAATIFYMYKTTLLENDDNVEKLAEVAVNKIISYLKEDTVGEIGNIENVILTAIKQKGELVEEHLKVYDEPTDPFTIDEIEKVTRLKESVLSELKPNKALDKVEVQKIVEEVLENFYKKTKSEKQPPKGTMFDLNKPIENFTGRKKDLEDLHEKLSGQSVTAIVQKISELSINSQTSNSGNLGSNGQQASVSGLGGIGKTQLALKYAEKYSTDYDNNVIWINAQDISGSFERLASKLGITKKDVDDDEKKTHDLAQEIYEHFKKAKSLFIFDNVENYQQIEKYLPKQFVGNKPSILITSRYRNWENTRVEVLDLDVFTLEEAKEFIRTKLEIAGGDSLQDKEINALAEKLGRLPLALAQAVAYIKQSKNINSKFGINDYLAIYDEKNKQLLGSDALEKSNDPYTKTVLTTWQVTLDKIKEEGVDGQKAIEILNIMAYFNPDEISNKIFLQLESSGNVNRAIQLLKDYSIDFFQN
ncbi:NB-ARC domain-containing protein [Wolbachia endosymbiont of Oedothorax gibbosus]|uniref:OTU domain-containing protein n=1 Tax=Oedothorax gibbosus TaxID=931172 RepID=A0AAV6TRJ0_9ARAC|nr:NB-ARC domain-containing protein [Wolbachia endosymbiont of Oedothorax gibbosus]KAG8174178.1 hypothetical protein JTE90_005897 [Oedothorax gibbosus]